MAPNNSDGHFQLAVFLIKNGECERAIDEGRRALELGPENSSPYDPLLACLKDLHRDTEAIDVGREALTVAPFRADLHYALGLALARQGDLISGANQFAYTLLLQPDWVEASAKLHLTLLSLMNAPDGAMRLREAARTAPDSPNMFDELAWLFATHPDPAFRNGENAVYLAQKACTATGGKTPALLNTLAASYAESGRFSEAIDIAQKALSLAESTGAADAAAFSQNLLTLFHANRPYRENPGKN